MPAAHRSIVARVPPERFMAVVTDFAAYPRFLPEMEEANVLRHEGDVWVVKFAVRVVRRLEYTLRLEKLSPTRLRWSLVEGMFKANNGGWELKPAADGAHTEANYEIALEIGMFVPGSVLKTLVESSLPATLEAFRREAEARG
jgi:ribosome-associated toxin RatA of RatAB toxin-antitoxin module